MSGVCVYLVGAGPGDAGLLTVRGAQLLAQADIVVRDYLVGEGILEQANPAAELLYVGKKGFSAHVTQQEVNSLLVRKAQELRQRGGGTVVRLKGGDPFVFGRGGEEALALAEAGIPFQVVPGITSGIAAPAYAGIPVTHRTVSSSVTFVTGHEDPSKNASALDWPALARLAQAGGTLCFYMGMRNLALVAERLGGQGLAGETPVALVRWGTLNRQQVLTSTLAEVAAEAARQGFGAPAIILVGQVAALHGQLGWFEARPLHGRRIVVTRSRTQASGLSRQLRELGAQVLEFPTIQIVPPESYSPLDGAISNLGAYRWVVFTSVNGVEAFFGRLQQGSGPHDARALAAAKVAAIGPATAACLARHGIEADALPGTYRGEAVFEAMFQAEHREGSSLQGARVLLARAAEAREALPQLLRRVGAQVDVVAAYRTVRPEGTADELVRRLRAGEVDAVTFTSSSTARNLLALLGGDADALARTQLASIGPITSQTLREAGFEPSVEAREYTVPGLVGVLEDLLGPAGPPDAAEGGSQGGDR